MSTYSLQVQILRRKHGLSEAAARLIALLHYGEVRNER